MLKVGLIGNGAIAAVHLSAYKRFYEAGEIEVVAVCDVCPERLEKEYLSCFADARTYTDVNEMLQAEQGQLDFVDICVPTFLHSEVAIKAMEAGFDVMSEKPMARTVAQAEEMIAASKRTGKRLMIAYCNRFYSGAKEIKRMIEEKPYGRAVSAYFRREGGDGKIFPFGWNNWFYDAELSGGALLDLHIHDVDMIRMMFGMPKAVSTTAASYLTKGGYDLLSTNFMFEDGLFVNATCDWFTSANRHDTRVIRVNFDDGYVHLDRSPDRNVFMAVSRDGVETDLSDKIAFDSYYEEIKYFASLIREGRELDYNFPEESIDSVKIVMAEMESADNDGARVAL